MAMMRGCVVAALVQLCASFAPTAQLHHMASPGRRCTHRDRAVTMATPEERLAALEEAMKALKVESAASPAERLAELEQGIAQLRKDMTADTADAPASPPSTEVPIELEAASSRAAPAATDFERLPSPATLGVEGQRCVLIFYAYDGIPKAETLLETFEDEASECASCGCALVAVRKVVDGDSADMRKAAEYEERFPSFNFITGLETPALDEIRRKVGLDTDWVRTLYYDPQIVLVDPDGGMRSIISHKGLSAANVLGNIMRNLHLAVPSEEAKISNAEAEANRQALYNENAEWAKVLEEDESLRQPTRWWFDMTPREAEKPLLSGVDAAALPEAIDNYLAGGDDADGEGAEEEEVLLSKDGVQAPAWYAKAKRTAEKKQEAERLLWNGTAPSGTAGPLPLGPAGARFVPAEQMARKALQEANIQQKKIVQAFFADFGGDEFRFLSGDDVGEEEPEALADDSDGSPPPPRSASTESALLRAEMLALGLSRSATSSQSTRRLRLLRELEASVKELESEGFNDRKALGKLKEQIRTSYETAPPEFIEEARRADPFNEALPRLSPIEIAAEFAKMAGSGADKLSKSLEKGMAAPDWESLNPGRKRGPRDKGNKIDISKRSADDDTL